MNLTQVVILSLLVYCVYCRNLKPKFDSERKLDVEAYLERYGYLRKSATDGNIQHSEESRKHAIRLFQRFAGLPDTGEIDKATVAKMKMRRCGVPDIIDVPDTSRPQEYKLSGRWRDKSLTWKVHSYAKGLSSKKQNRAFSNALKRWESNSGLDFRPATADEKAHINISFVSGDHGDGDAFDGEGGILAHAFGPYDGRTHFDADEKWRYHNNRDIELEITATHELGHALGLSHSTTRGSVMVPFYQPYTPGFRLHADDIAGIQVLYGPEGYIHLFIGLYLYKLKDSCAPNESCVLPGYPRLVKSVYEKAPRYIGAAAFIPDQRKRTYLFKGRKIWRYTGYKLDPGYPKRFNKTVMPFKPTAAYVHKNQYADYQLYLFGGKYFWEMNLYSDLLTNGVMKTRMYWTRMPNSPDAIVQTWNGYIYVFKGKYYRKYDHMRDLMDKKKLKSPAWLGGICRYAPR